VYAAFYDEYSQLKAFLHSHSYTGNALACRAALATLDLFEREDTLARNQILAAHMGAAAAPLAEHPQVAEVRQTGMIVAIEMVRDKARREAYPWQERRGLRAYRHALTRGVLLRPLGNVIYFIPPYVISPDEITLMATVAAESIAIATAD
jgi:adenosylmethionine-8-amino-7-oxononanoate aminotransferase